MTFTKELYLQFGEYGGPYLTQKVEHKTTNAPRNNSVSGYGSKIPTQYMVKYNNRWRRVYCICWSNVGTLYIMIDGKKVIVQEYDSGN